MKKWNNKKVTVEHHQPLNRVCNDSKTETRKKKKWVSFFVMNEKKNSLKTHVQFWGAVELQAIFLVTDSTLCLRTLVITQTYTVSHLAVLLLCNSFRGT